MSSMTELRATKMVKPPSKVPQNHWMAKTVSKEFPPKTTPLTRTQKKRLRRANSVQKMKGILQMLTVPKEKDTHETHVASIVIAFEQAFPKHAKDSATTSNTIKTPMLTIS